MWNHRLLQFNGDRRFADIMERGLYNGFLSGVSLDGRHFFYENPLSTDGTRHHEEWFECPCCPPNVARMLASIGDYFYSTGPQDLWVHLFAANQAQVEIDGQTVTVEQDTQYPWNGTVRLTLTPAHAQTFTLHVRVPGWCEQYSIAINGEVQAITTDQGGYLAILRAWQPGDRVDFTMEMPVQPVWANPAVRQLEGRVAIQRGPVVYCLEGVDHGGIVLDRISVNPQAIASFTVSHRTDLLGGVTILEGQGKVIEACADGALYSSKAPVEQAVQIRAIPYYAWDNRAPGEMRVWLRTSGGRE
jgi:DUF1680 family protein